MFQVSFPSSIVSIPTAHTTDHWGGESEYRGLTCRKAKGVSLAVIADLPISLKLELSGATACARLHLSAGAAEG